jgi:hypothetical protein
MNELSPCTECNRHGRVSEGACPFCGATLSSVAAPPVPNRRMSRAALVAFGATVATGMVATGCSSDDDGGGSGGSGATAGSGGGGTGGAATGGQGGSAGTAGNAGVGAAGPLYGLPPLDGGAGQGGSAGANSLYGGPPTDGG